MKPFARRSFRHPLFVLVPDAFTREHEELAIRLPRIWFDRRRPLNILRMLTTRPRRASELDETKLYEFVTRDCLHDLLQRRRLLHQTNIHGDLYGITRADAQRVLGEGYGLLVGTRQFCHNLSLMGLSVEPIHIVRSLKQAADPRPPHVEPVFKVEQKPGAKGLTHALAQLHDLLARYYVPA